MGGGGLLGGSYHAGTKSIHVFTFEVIVWGRALLIDTHTAAVVLIMALNTCTNTRIMLQHLIGRASMKRRGGGKEERKKKRKSDEGREKREERRKNTPWRIDHVNHDLQIHMHDS